MLENFLKNEELGGEFDAAVNAIRGGIPSAAVGVTFAEKCLLTARLGLPVLYIVKDGLYGRKVAEEISAMTGKEVVYLPAKDDVLLFKTAFDKAGLYSRIEALGKIAAGAETVVATFESLLQLFPKKLPFVTIEKGGSYDLSELAALLVKAGYRREEFSEDKGTFAVRGDILEIYPVNGDFVYRADFFGDEVEKIRKFNGDGSGDKEETDSVFVMPATDVVLEDGEAEKIKRRIEESVMKFSGGDARKEARNIADEIVAALDTGAYSDCLQFVLPITENATGDLASLMPPDTVVIYDEPKMLSENLAAVVKEHSERYFALLNAGKAFDFTFLQLSDKDKLVSSLKKFRNASFQNISTSVGFFEPLKTFGVKCSPVPRYAAKPETVYADVANWKYGGYKVVICCGNEARAAKAYDDFNINGAYASRKEPTSSNGGSAYITADFLPTGFILHEAKLAVVGTGDLFIGLPEKKRLKRRRGDMFRAPEIGDFAVHDVHGIGYVKGVTRITTQEGSKDYVAVEYYGGDVLYVGVDNMDKLSRYVGGEGKPTLNKIGGKEFDRVKERVRKSISEMTVNLKKLYAARKEKKGFVFSPDNELTEEFARNFEFEPTEDQLQSIEEIRSDMESGKVMDRLLCGDVGFGKTEVAFRAAFKAIADGKQVALVCPTTILCEQHFREAKKRFSPFGIKVESLNRFRTEKEQNTTVKRLIDGDVDFVIGTHRLFGKDVGFKDLGLLILDEEQRFGVEHKETLKVMRENVDTLTLTATPIPRTLHLSLSGIRDISVINTPPKNRIPVQTYVTEESDALIRDAVMREKARSGQVFVLYNRVESIYRFADEFKSIVPEATTIVAHGRMDKKTLEDSVFSFYDGKADVLIATTIIENGIDLPRANTLIVIDSDRLGLSTLYQLKGRVGRSGVMAHAYFTYKREKVMTENAYKRLNALMEFTEMGSGYKIAMRDLEIRGAGNVLGREQHGHMDKIGYELYNKLLRESLGEVTKNAEVEMDVKMDAYIPEEYVYGSSSRMDCYKQIAEIANEEDENRIKSSLKENYGDIPRQVLNLIDIAKLKARAKKHGAIGVSVSEKKSFITLNGLDSLKEEGYIDRINARKGRVTLSFGVNPELTFGEKGDSTEKIVSEMLDFMDF